MIELSACPVCGYRSLHHAFTAPTTRGMDQKRWRVDECDGCGHQFMNPQPSWDELQRYYTSDYAAYDTTHGIIENDEADTSCARQTGVYRHIAIKPGAFILDVGSGGGTFLRVASKLGARAKGVEPSPYAAEQARKQGLDVFNGSLEDFAANTTERFDIITANHVIEHVPNPVDTLASMRSILAPLASSGFLFRMEPTQSTKQQKGVGTAPICRII